MASIGHRALYMTLIIIGYLVLFRGSIAFTLLLIDSYQPYDASTYHFETPKGLGDFFTVVFGILTLFVSSLFLIPGMISRRRYKKKLKAFLGESSERDDGTASGVSSSQSARSP